MEQEFISQRREIHLLSSTIMATVTSAEYQQFRIPAKQTFLPLKATRFTKMLQKSGRQHHEREFVTSDCRGSKIFGSQQTVVLQIWQESKKIKKIDTYDFPVHHCTQEQKQ